MKSKQWSHFDTYRYCISCVPLILIVFRLFFRFEFVFRHQTGNIYKMSRNKDRYESSNPRRQQIFMSQEDVAAGRKSNWTGVEITGEFIHTDRKPTSHALYLHTSLSSQCLFCERVSAHVCMFIKNLQAMYATSVQRYGNSIISPHCI